MFDEIIFTSSYSSQLGALICLSKHYAKINSAKSTKNILVFHISSKGDLKCNYSCFKENSELIIGRNLNLKEIKKNNIFKRFFLFILINSLFIFNLDKKINIWQPSPYWINNLFKFKKINLNFIKNYFRNRNFYGDGFLCLSLKSVPFWLTEKEDAFKENYSGNFFYFYEIDTINKDRKNFIKLDAVYIKKILYKLENNLLNNTKDLKKNNLMNNLIIFPLTTFSETARASIDGEINLYLEYIKANVDKNNEFILVKPHPGSLKIKTDLLINKLTKLNYQVINNYFEKSKIIKIPLNIIPLELLCLLLVNKFNLKFKDIKMTINSNASLSTFYLFPEINFLKPFGVKLISKYIRKGFVKKRLLQEEILINKIYRD